MKIALLGNQARAMSNFWSVLIRTLIQKGHTVLCIVPAPSPQDDPAWEDALTALGATVMHYPLDRKGLNPAKDWRTLLALQQLCKKEAPDALFAFTIKPVIYGAFAAFLAGKPLKQNRFVMITGLGYMFEGDSFIKKILMRVACLLYRLAFSCVNTVFFQNNDDKTLFSNLAIIPSQTHVAMCKGTGVDITHFATNTPPPTPIKFLFVGRLIEAKGLRDLYQATKILKTKHPHVQVSILGPAESGLGSVPLSEVTQWQQEGIIEYLGETKDVRPYLEQASVVILPSWREGTPCSLMEAFSMGRAVIAANAPGSKEVVIDQENGFLVPVKDPTSLANAMEKFMINPPLAQTMGKAGQQLMHTEFSADVVANSIIQQMRL